MPALINPSMFAVQIQPMYIGGRGRATQTASTTLAVPTGSQVGDLAVMMMYTNMNVPSGWTSLGTFGNMIVVYTVLTSTSDISLSSSGSSCGAQVTTFRYTDGVPQISTNSTTNTAPPLTNSRGALSSTIWFLLLRTSASGNTASMSGKKPTGYTNGTYSPLSTVNSLDYANSAYKQAAIATETPGPWGTPIGVGVHYNAHVLLAISPP